MSDPSPDIGIPEGMFLYSYGWNGKRWNRVLKHTVTGVLTEQYFMPAGLPLYDVTVVRPTGHTETIATRMRHRDAAKLAGLLLFSPNNDNVKLVEAKILGVWRTE